MFDRSTDALAGVTVVATGTVRWTLVNLWLGTGPKTFRAQTRTDSSGRFALSFRAATATLSFDKQGYAGPSFFLTRLDGSPLQRDGSSGESVALDDLDLSVRLESQTVDHAFRAPTLRHGRSRVRPQENCLLGLPSPGRLVILAAKRNILWLTLQTSILRMS